MADKGIEVIQKIAGKKEGGDISVKKEGQPTVKKKSTKRKIKKPVAKFRKVEIQELKLNIIHEFDEKQALVTKEFSGNKEFLIDLGDGTVLVFWIAGSIMGSVNQFLKSYIKKVEESTLSNNDE